MTSATRPGSRPVARLTSPGEIAAVVPVLCGFVPEESLVAVSLRGPRKRVGLTMRFDLAWAVGDLAATAAEVADRLAVDGASQVVLVVYSTVNAPEPVLSAVPEPEPEPSPELEQKPSRARDVGTPDAPVPDAPADFAGLAWADLVAAVEAACEPEGIRLNEALLVRDGRWWSYLCRRPTCCPPEGTALEGRSTPALELVEAERVLGGRVVLASREELRATVAGPTLLAARSAEQQLDLAVDRWLDRYQREGREALRTHSLRRARALVARVEAGGTVDGAEACELAVAVQDVRVRDEVGTWCLRRSEALLSTLLQTARQVVPPEDAAVLALLGWVAYAHGDGGLANVALERCLASDPEHSLGTLLAEMLHRQVPPREVRKLMRKTRGALRS